MNEYIANLDKFNPSPETATSGSVVSNKAEGIQNYNQIPNSTIVDITDIHEETTELTTGSYLLPKKVIVKTYKLKKI